ncbi:glycan biosynthesis hexose transferase WsfD [Paraburkholderia tropica]|uniref:glycan biosynthesis hexose transferase WsfD n=1 Tax=Paraburkholderia tropica TaxID=92647 RepID=UPI002AB5EF62|nr:hypothetical protein [Paraburkholderia tropica]
MKPITKKNSATAVLVFALLAITFVKIVLVVFASPLMGYGNNYDFIRQSSCVGVYQTYPGEPARLANPQAPVDTVIYSGVIAPSTCMRSIDNVYPWIASRFHKVGDRIGFQTISAWKIATLLAFGLCLMVLVKDRWSRLVVTLAFALIFGDLGVLLYANTLYLEFSVVMSGFFAVFATALLLSGQHGNKSVVAFALIAMLWLGATKQQYMPLAAALGLTCALALWLRGVRKRYALVFVVSSLCIPVAYALANHTDSSLLKAVRFANNTDTWLGAVLPAAPDKAAALARVGLPPSCEPGIGKTWYDQGMQAQHPCPAVEHISRVRLLSLFLYAPATFTEPMYQAIQQTYPFYTSYLGHLSSPDTANTRSYRLLRVTSLSHWLARQGPEGAVPETLFALIVAAIALLAWLRTWHSDPGLQLPLAITWLGGGLIIYSLASSVFGDGYIELQKHAVLLLPGFGFVLAGALLSLCKLVGMLAARRASP